MMWPSVKTSLATSYLCDNSEKEAYGGTIDQVITICDKTITLWSLSWRTTMTNSYWNIYPKIFQEAPSTLAEIYTTPGPKDDQPMAML